MKISVLRNKILKFLVKSYYQNKKLVFDLTDIRNKFPKVSEFDIKNACVALESDGFVSLFFADDAIYSLTLNIQGIIQTDDDTFLRKGYSVIKEIRSWI